MNIKLKEGEMICPVCNGTGNDKQNMFVCEKCDGIGKVDWVSNVIPQNKEITSLDRINVERLIIHLKSFVNDLQVEPADMDTVKGMVGDYLTTLKDRKAIYDYEITKTFAGGYNFDVLIKPSRFIDVITMNIKNARR